MILLTSLLCAACILGTFAAYHVGRRHGRACGYECAKQLGNSLRQACNHLTPEQREIYRTAAMKVIRERANLLRKLAKEEARS